MPDRKPAFFVTLLQRLRTWWDETPAPPRPADPGASGWLEEVGRGADAALAAHRARTAAQPQER